MFSRTASESNFHELSVLLLTATLAIGGCERRPEHSSGRASSGASQSSTYEPPKYEASAMTLVEGTKVQDFEDIAALQRRANTFQAFAYSSDLYENAAGVLKDLIKVDREAGGLLKSDQLESLLRRMMDAGKAFGRAKEAINKYPIDMDPVEHAEATLALIGGSIVGQTEFTWERTNIPDGEMSPGAKEAQEMLENFEKVIKTFRENQWRLYAQDGKQPQLTFALPLGEAAKLCEQGQLSISSKDFIVATLPKDGPSHLRLGITKVDHPNEHNWRGFLYILGGMKQSADEQWYKADLRYPSQSLYVRIDDNNLLRVEQAGLELRFAKNSSGYGEAGVEGTVLGFGGGADFPISNIYARISYLEALAYIDGDWEKIRNGIIEQQRTGLSTIDPKLVERTLAPLVTDRLDGPPSDLNSFSIVSYDGKARVLPPKDPVPVFMRLKDSTLLKIHGGPDDIRFYRTSSGYAVAGGKVHTPVGSAGAEVPLSHVWTEITPAEALGYFDNDWKPIFNAVAKQARVVPDSVWPSSVLRKINPNAPEPKLTVHSFQEPAPYLGR